jgi:hypothetical protein
LEKMANKKHIKLNSARDIRKALTKLVNQVNRDEIELDRARTLGYLCKIILDGIKTIEIEEKLCELDKLVRQTIREEDPWPLQRSSHN